MNWFKRTFQSKYKRLIAAIRVDIKALRKNVHKINEMILGALSEINSRLETIEKSSLKNDVSRLNIRCRTLESRIKTLEMQTHIGVDYSFNKRDRSWAIVCKAGPNGKPDILKMYDLTGKSVEELKRFMDHLPNGDRKIDASIPVYKAMEII